MTNGSCLLLPSRKYPNTQEPSTRPNGVWPRPDIPEDVIGKTTCAHGRSEVGSIVVLDVWCPKHRTLTLPVYCGSVLSSTTPTNHRKPLCPKNLSLFIFYLPMHLSF